MTSLEDNFLESRYNMSIRRLVVLKAFRTFASWKDFVGYWTGDGSVPYELHGKGIGVEFCILNGIPLIKVLIEFGWLKRSFKASSDQHLC